MNPISLAISYIIAVFIIWMIAFLVHERGFRKGFAAGCANERNFYNRKEQAGLRFGKS